MQIFTSVASSDTLTDSREPLLDNDMTAISCSAGTVFPQSYQVVGMLCYRTDQAKLYQLHHIDPKPQWNLISDLEAGYLSLTDANSRFATKSGDYVGLRARDTRKVDVGLENVPNKVSDSLGLPSSESLATSKAVYSLNKKILQLESEMSDLKLALESLENSKGDKNKDFVVRNLTVNGSIQAKCDITAYSDRFNPIVDGEC